MTYIITAVVIIAVAAVAWWFWQRGGHQTPDFLKPGNPLPLFLATDEDGKRLDSSSLEGTPAVILFVRGSWCPFCSAQVRDLTGYYKSIVDTGARLILVTPKPLETTRRVAEFFEVDFDFWLDEDLAIAKALNLVQEAGVPKGWDSEYGHDTVWPTALVVDAGGTIRFTELSKHIVDRPNPKKLLNALEATR